MEITESLRYEPETGLFFWTVNRGGADLGSEAGNLKPTGYVQIMFKRKMYRAHRLAFLFMLGEPLDDSVVVDHIDGNPSFQNQGWMESKD